MVRDRRAMACKRLQHCPKPSYQHPCSQTNSLLRPPRPQQNEASSPGRPRRLPHLSLVWKRIQVLPDFVLEQPSGPTGYVYHTLDIMYYIP